MPDVAHDHDVLVRLVALEDELRGLKSRLDRLEGHAPVAADAPEATLGSAKPPEPQALVESLAVPAAEPPAASLPPSLVAAPAAAPEEEEEAGGESLVALAGTLLVALAGAYLIRALTDGGTLSPAAGVALGLLYALAFLPLAARAATAERPLAASAHGVTAALVAYPLLWETTARFKALPPQLALFLLVGVMGLALALAVRRGLGAVAWVHTLFALASSLGLLVATLELTTVAAALLAQAALVELLVRRPKWFPLRWLAAGALDLGLLALVLLVGRAEGLPEGYPALSPAVAVVLALFLPALYVLRVAGGTLRSGRSVTLFETLQLAAGVAIGFEGAARILAAREGSTFALGLAGLALGLVGYAVAFTFVERRQGRGANFYVYSTAGGLFLLIGSQHVLGPAAQDLAWASLAVAAAVLARRFDRTTLGYHALAYLAAAGISSGLWSLTGGGLFGQAPVTVPLLALAAWAAGLAVYVVLARDGERAGWPLVPRALAALLTCAPLPGAVGALVGAAGATAVTVMALRTAALAVLVVILAALGHRRGPRPELGGLAYLALAVGGLKLLSQDLPAGHAGELFASFLLFGGALVLASRLLRARR